MKASALPHSSAESLDHFFEHGLHETFVYSWDDSHNSQPIRFGAAASPQHLFFGAYCPRPPRCHPSDRIGVYVEGLWEFDVCEMFVSSDQNSSYQEFNLAPHGAWWSAVFSDYRTPVGALPLQPQVDVRSRVDRDSWRTAISIHRDSLSVSLGPKSRIGICGIMGLEPRHFLCSFIASSATPDFHRSGDYTFTLEVSDL